MGWYAKDGKEYKTFNDMVRANDAWDTQRAEQSRQAYLLNEQNNLIRKQQEAQRLEAQKDRESKERIEREKISHEKEMRLLKLCDEIGISKKIYDDFVDKLTSQKNSNKLDKIHDKEIEIENELERIEKIKKAAEIGTYKLYDLDLSGYEDCYDNIKTNPKIQNLENIIKSFEDKIEDNKKNNIKEINTKLYEKILYICLGIIIGSIVIGNIIENYDGIFFLLAIITLFAGTYFLIKYENSTERLKLKIEANKKTIDEEKNKIKSSKIFSVDKLKEKKIIIEKEYDKLEKEKEVLINQSNEEVNKNYLKFEEFRKNHYNKDIEKFLHDMDLATILENYNVKYSSITSSNKKKSGVIENYIDYFIDFK